MRIRLHYLNVGLLSFLHRKQPAPPPEEPKKTFGPLTRSAFDQISNWMTGQGGVMDPATANDYLIASTENWASLINIYRSSWLARKIVRQKPKDMLRAGYDLIWEGSGDKKKGAKQTQADQIREACHRCKLDAKLLEALMWSRLFGGSVIVIGIKGQLLDEPLPVVNGAVDYSGIKKGDLEYLSVFDRWRANHAGEMDEDPKSPNCGHPKYHVLMTTGALSGQRVHWTRVVRFDGAIVPWWTWRANACWHDSELQVLIELLKQYDSTTGAISALVPKARKDIVYAKGLVKDLAENPDAVSARYAATTRMASLWHVTLLDIDKEKFEPNAYNFSGLDKIWEKCMKEVAGATDYPVSLLFGDEPSGMNATGDASIRNYYDNVAGLRESDLKPRHLRLLECIVRNELGDLPPGFAIQYKPLWQASEIEKSQINLNRANADHIRIDDGIIDVGLAAREAKEDCIYKTMTDDDVNMVSELSEPAGEEDDEERMEGEGGKNPGQKATPEGSAFQLTPTAMASIVQVNQALAKIGLPPWPDSDGELTIAEFQAKHSGVVAAAVNAEAGNKDGKVASPPAKPANGDAD